MKLTSPKLNIDEEATDSLIESSLSKLKAEVDSFAILGMDEMNYIQALSTENGFVVQFQLGSLDEHYEFDTYLSRPKTIQLFQAYLQGTENWQGNLTYTKVQIMSMAGKLGFAIGSFFGSLVKGWKDASRKHNKRLQTDADEPRR
jgi:hypothetical protein